MPILATVFKECGQQSDKNEIHCSFVMYINALIVLLAMFIYMWMVHTLRLKEGYVVTDEGYCWCKGTLYLFCVLYSIELISCKKDSTRFLKERLVQMHYAHITPGVSTSTAASHAVSMSLIVRIYSSCTPKISMTTLTSWMGSFSLTAQLIVASPPVTGV